jgi:hypothetical protein
MIEYYRRDYKQLETLKRIEVLLCMIYNNTRPEGTEALPILKEQRE